MKLSLEPPHPLDRDHESYCTHPRCTRPATHQRLTALNDGIPVYELVCCTHAQARGD